MENEVLDALDDLRYEEKLDEPGLKKLLSDNASFSKLLEWISREMKSTEAMDETITKIENANDVQSFHMELSSCLKELGCPYPQLLDGSMEERFGSEDRRLLALNFLLGELQAARIHYVNNSKQLKVELAESDTARLLREMMQTLGIPKPPAGVTVNALLTRVNERVNKILKKVPAKLKDKPCFNGHLSEKQWGQLEDLNREMKEEYLLRREMLLKRLDVTVQSFHWSDRLKSKKEDINRIFRQKRNAMDPNPNVSISQVLAARSDLAVVAKTCDAIVRKHTRSEVNKVVIGRVPDRGGRPNEAQPPPPEMPPWQQRQGGTHGWAPGPQQKRDYGEGRGARGSSQKPRVQGGWSDHGQQQNYQQQNYQQQQQNFDNYGGNQYSQQQQSHGGGRGGYQNQRSDGGGYYQDRNQGQQQYGDGGYNNRGDGYEHRGGRGGHRGGGRGGGGHRGGGGGGYRGGRHQY